MERDAEISTGIKEPLGKKKLESEPFPHESRCDHDSLARFIRSWLDLLTEQEMVPEGNSARRKELRPGRAVSRSPGRAVEGLVMDGFWHLPGSGRPSRLEAAH